MADPVALTPPTLSPTGQIQVGQTVTCTPGTYSPAQSSFTYDWQREGATDVWSDIPGAVGNRYTAVAADVGHRLRCGVDPILAPGGPGMRDCSLAAWNALLPSGMSVVTVSNGSASSVINAYNAMPSGGGQLLDVTVPVAMTNFSPRRKFTGLNAIRFCDGCTNTNTIEVESANLAVWGLEVKDCLFVSGSYSGHGLAFSNCTNVRWWGFKAHDVDAHCLFVFANVGPNTGLDIDGELYACGQAWVRNHNTSVDPHPQKGTGLHAAYIGAQDVSNTGNSGKFSFRAHDCVTGGINLGNSIHDSDFWIDARRLTCNVDAIAPAPAGFKQVAGNPMMWWTKSGFPQLSNVRVHYAYGEDCAGRMSETDGLVSGGVSNLVVEYARHLRMRLDPQYLAHSGITYTDCQ